jgi:tetratricopeptide (TPR) repeat protein
MRNNKALLAIACVALIFCASPLKNKGPFWYNGYVYGTRAFSFYSEGKFELAISFYRKALSEAQQLDIPKQSGLYRFNIGRCWLELDNFDSALVFFTGSYSEFSACHDSLSVARAAGFIALTYDKLGKSDSAFAWYKRGTAIESGKNERALWLFIHGHLLWSRDHGKEALTYFEEAFALYKKQKGFHAMAEICRLSAGVRYYFAEYQDAKKLIDEALRLGDRSVIRAGRFRILLSACSIYIRLNDDPTARQFYKRAKQCAPETIKLPEFNTLTTINKYLF